LLSLMLEAIFAIAPLCAMRRQRVCRAKSDSERSMMLRVMNQRCCYFARGDAASALLYAMRVTFIQR